MKETIEYQNIHENRKYKDSLFRMVFKEKEDYSLKKAIILAIDECIEKGILLDILTKERNEVVAVVLETFNKELYEKNLKEDAYEEGVKMGENNALICKVKIKLEKGKSVEQIAEELEEKVERIQEYIKTINEQS